MKKVHKYIFFFMSLLAIIFVFNSKPVFAVEENLGYQYSSSRTVFRLYSSEASEVKVIVEDIENGTVSLAKSSNSNVWTGFVVGDLSGKEYSYYVKLASGEEHYNVIDPYGKFLNATKTKNVVYDTNTLIDNNVIIDPETMLEITEEREYLKINETSRIIYGIDVNNFTSHTSWNGSENKRGKLLGIVEEGTTYGGSSTGFDYVSNLGITYLELSHIYDELLPFTIDNKYVTGTESFSGYKELNEIRDKYYTKGVGIVLPFNYKFLNNSFISNIQKIDKNSYLDDTNKIDLNKEQTKQYIISLLKYYVQEHMIAGIMIENMADYSVSFINDISTELKKINSNIYIYGNGNYEVENENNAGQNNLKNLNNVNMLNSSLNYGLFGNLLNNTDTGILDGNYDESIIETLKFTLLNTVSNQNLDYSKVLGVSYKNYWGNSTSRQIINYFGSREGLSIYDKLFMKNFTSDSVIKEKFILSFSFLMISGGTPYIYSGEEFLSSYIDTTKSADSICNDEDKTFCFYSKENKKYIDWSYVKTNESVVNSFKSYINFKKSNSEIIQDDSKQIQNNVELVTYEDKIGTIGYIRNYPNALTRRTQKVFVIFNFSNNKYTLNEKNEKGIQGLYNYNSSNRDADTIVLNGNSFYSEKKVKQPKMNNWVSLIVALGLIGGVYFLNIFLNRKLVEEKGYDIKQIKKKYRPFIKTKEKVETSETQKTSETKETTDEEQK